MPEGSSTPEIKISKDPQIQKEVDQKKEEIYSNFPGSNEKLVNQYARDSIAANLRRLRLRKESAIDSLTRALSPKAYNAEKTRILGTISRDQNISTSQGIRFDLDNFGLINKNYGDNTGNLVLAQIGKNVQAAIRSTDTFGRIGGEEFEAIAPRTKNPNRIQGKNSQPLSEKIREAIENCVIENGIRITASFGVTEFIRGEQIAEYDKRLENAQVAAKRLGKNRVVEARKTKHGFIYIDHKTKKKYTVERDAEGRILDPVEIK